MLLQKKRRIHSSIRHFYKKSNFKKLLFFSLLVPTFSIEFEKTNYLDISIRMRPQVAASREKHIRFEKLS